MTGARLRFISLATVVFCCACWTGCAGNGDGLDENGRPAGEEPPPLVAEFQSIQDNVFTPICTTCHAGGAAPVGLRLDEGASYAMLVNAPSVEVPGLLRVDPGNPDDSYLIQKIEGHAAVGDQMPLGGPPLPSDTIAIIRQWITDGAQPPSAEELSATAAVQLAVVDPVAGAEPGNPPPLLLVEASGELDTSRLDGATVRLERSGGDDRFHDGNESLASAMQIQIRNLSPTIFAIRPGESWQQDRYRLVIAGTGPDPVSDRGGRLIDGDGDGQPGGDFEFEFQVRMDR
jgi:hypothetical protein